MSHSRRGTRNLQQGYLDSRFIAMFDVAEPRDVNVRFVYNFFVPDEKTNASGNEQFHGGTSEQQQRAPGAISSQDRALPRYMEIQFEEVQVGANTADVDLNFVDPRNRRIVTDNQGSISSEEQISTVRDVTIKYHDEHLRERISGKASLLASILGADPDNVSEQYNVITQINTSIDGDNLREILPFVTNAKILAVNEMGDLPEVLIFSDAAQLEISTLTDRRLLKSTLGGNYTTESSAKTQRLTGAIIDALRWLPTAGDDSGDDSYLPRIDVLDWLDFDTSPSDRVGVYTVGYQIQRTGVRSDGSPHEPISFPIDGPSTTRFLDTEVLYDSTYTYRVRTIAYITMTVESFGGQGQPDPGSHKIGWLLASNPSTPITVKAEELIPPLDPDGVFYRFDYDSGRGLYIRWQIPSGKQRDVKYFQIFRRKTIHDPFTCIAEIDFDDSEIKSLKRELVNESRVIKSPGPVTVFLDSAFDRSSSFIYAVAALDAHGMSSSLSAQSLVSFDRINNQIELKYISRPGAPKQYPNFFIDPDLDDNIFVSSLSQDAMQVSQKSAMRIYFTPDSHRYSRSAGDGGWEPLLMTANDALGFYKLHLLNIDRQKSATMELRIREIAE